MREYAADDLLDFVAESNRIEGLRHSPHPWELAAHENLWALDVVTVADLEEFVQRVAGAVLRDWPGLDVRVGQHVPPRGGPGIRFALETLLAEMQEPSAPTPREVHVRYETLHPFTDGNGRSGRALWAWQMLHEDRWPGIRLGFLHAYYYQTLQESR